MAVLIAPDSMPVIGPLIFLGGPIQNARPWQEEAIEIIQLLDPGIHIASPRRRGVERGEFTDSMYYEQVDWETEHLMRAGQHGVVMFWLECEETHSCGRSFAQTTRFELGVWSERARLSAVKLVVGVGPNFSGTRYIRYHLYKHCSHVPVRTTLEDTCRWAVDMANRHEL